MQAILHQQTAPKACCCGPLWLVLQLNHKLLYVKESRILSDLIMKQQCPQTASTLQPLYRDCNCPLHHHIGFLARYFLLTAVYLLTSVQTFQLLIIDREHTSWGWHGAFIVCVLHYDELAVLSKFQVPVSCIWWCSDGTPMEGRKKSFKKKKHSTAFISYEMPGSNVKL